MKKILTAYQSCYTDKNNPDANYAGSTNLYFVDDLDAGKYRYSRIAIGFREGADELDGLIIDKITLEIYCNSKAGTLSESAQKYFRIQPIWIKNWVATEVTYNNIEQKLYTSSDAPTILSSYKQINGNGWNSITLYERGVDKTLWTIIYQAGLMLKDEGNSSGTIFFNFASAESANKPRLVIDCHYGVPEITNITPNYAYFDGNDNVTFNWDYQCYDAAEQSKFEIQCAPKDTEQWFTLVSQESSSKSYTCLAGTLGSGTIQWRMRVCSEYGVWSDWCALKYIAVQSRPTAPIVTVTAGTRPTVEWLATGQYAYQIKIDDTQCKQAYGNDTSYKIGQYLTDGLHTAAVRIQNNLSLWSDWGTANFTVANTPGAAITLFAAGGEEAALAWTETDHEAYYVYRDDIPIAKTTGHTYTDQMAIGTHKYKVRGVTGDNYSMSNEVTVTLSVDMPEIAALSDMQWLKLKHSTAQNSPLGVSVYQDVAYQFYAGRRYPVAETSQQITKTYSFNVAFGDEAQAVAFEGLLGKTVVYRDQHNHLFTGPLMAYELSVDQFFSAFTCSIQQTDNMERIEYD